jgi:hypothetical protein
MSNLNAIPGYNELNARQQEAAAQRDQFIAQRDAARAAGNEEQAQEFQRQASVAAIESLDLATQRADLVSAANNADLASPVVTTGQNQSTPPPNARDDGPTQAPTSGGTGAGTSRNAYQSVGADDNPRPVSVNVSTAALNNLIPTQANQLDQYASYTYALSWYLLSPQQFNALGTSRRPNTAGWKLLCQSGGAPSAGRSQAFSLDYYMDDLEIVTKSPGPGTRMAHSATDLRFKIVEPNGITLIENLFNAVQSVYKTAQQPQADTSNNGAPAARSATTNAPVNYLTAYYCMVIQFYGYDVNGKLVAPAKGSFNTDSPEGGYGQNAVIVKYYPFRLTDIKFQVASRAIEYSITGKPQGQYLGFTTDRGTIPFGFAMTGQTVDQLLNGSPIVSGGSSSATSQADPGARKDSPAPNVSVNDINVNAGVDALGNFTGETYNPNAVIAP